VCTPWNGIYTSGVAYWSTADNVARLVENGWAEVNSFTTWD